MPDVYRRMLDPFLSLMAMAGATTDLKLGTAVVLPLEHDVFDLAKRVSTLDLLSGGRLMFGVGAGWNEHELANCRSIGWSRRYEALSECVGALKALWCDEEAAFHGRFFDFEPVWSDPKPAATTPSAHPVRNGGQVGDAQRGRVGRRVDAARRRVGERREEAATVPGRGRSEREDRCPGHDRCLGRSHVRHPAALPRLGVERVIVGVARAGLDDPSTTLPFLDSSAALIDRLR